MSGVDLPTVKEILGHREIEMTLRYSHLAPAHKAKAVEKLGEALNNAVQNRENRTQEAQEPRALVANLAQNRNIFLVRSGRGLSVIEPKPKANQGVNPTSNWWRRGESNPRPKVFHLGDYMLSRCFDLAP
jgi:hypothetical protein